MDSTTSGASSEAISSNNTHHASKITRLPVAVRLPLACFLVLGLSMLLNTLISEFTGIQLAAPSRYLIENWKIGAMVEWRIAQVVVAWVAGYDWIDLTALTFLTNYPFYYLLSAFWGVPGTAISVSLTIDVLSLSLPFYLLRPSAHPRTIKTANQALAADWSIMLLFAFQGVAIYASVFYLSYYATFLAEFLITHFDVQSLESAHGASLATLLLHFALNGFAAMLFLFQPGMAAPSRPSLTDSDADRPPALSTRSKTFNPETASLDETIMHNLGFAEGSKWSLRARVLVKRVAVLAGCVWANTAIRSFATVEGTDLVGALGWGGIWTVANLLVGVAYIVLENEY